MSEFPVEIPDEFRRCFYIDGRWVPTDSARRAALVSPVTDKEFLSAPLADGETVDRAVQAAGAAFADGPWPRMPSRERAGYLVSLASEIRSRLPLLARLWTTQVGAPARFAEQLIRVGQSRFDFFAGLAGEYAFEERRPTPRGHAVVVREPVGVSALVAPWNATFNLFASKVPAALAAGCTVILKSPVESPLEALVIAECADAVGIPLGVLNVITADAEESARLVNSPGVDKISFTGSVATGRHIAEAAARRFARSTLELGGKSAAILLEEADLSAVVRALMPVTMPLSRQTCFSQTRVLAPRSRLDAVADAVAQAAATMRVGDPADLATDVGPVVSARQYDRVLRYIESGCKDGARVLVGGGRPAGFERGYFIAPTVFTDVTPDMTVAREEIFGPVLVVLPYDDIDDAVRIANDTEFGLSGTVFGPDPQRALAVARRVTSGHLAVNGFEIAPNVPFGGRKSSGYGREGGREGLEAYLETKALLMPGQAPD